MQHKYTNALIKETSPYLLQHAHNPVNWEAWGPEVLARAKEENKPLLISIGYAACHWCHVMEHECFEDEEVAQIMNANFINIKIDREERPDVDQIYMDALQMMSGSGGWPLNIVALPDGKPFWGATYVPKDNWIKSLKQLTTLYQEQHEKVAAYAADLEKGIKAINLVEANPSETTFDLKALDQTVAQWATQFDTFLGGYKRAPKFMMPNNLDFLMHYAALESKDSVMAYVDTTLTRMAYGGIFDHVGGGFSRYAVDTKWHVPHFEKMLYDNGQLTSLYAKAFARTNNPLYRSVVEKTIAFATSELMDESGGFYASLDADSNNAKGELEEGAYYVWTAEELQAILKEDFSIFKDYYNINTYGLWEAGNYVLIRDKTDTAIAQKHGITVEDLRQLVDDSLQKLKVIRDKRPRPRLDDKVLSAWNGLMLKGLIDAYRYLGEDRFLDLALNTANFLKEEMIDERGKLFRNYKKGKRTINGFLDDYATVIEAFIALYEVTFDNQWLQLATTLTTTVIQDFKDRESGLFYYTSTEDDPLIRRTLEINDNVISSSNSIMAKNLLKLHKLYPKADYGTQATQMVQRVAAQFKEYASGFANWLHLILYYERPFYEVAVVGQQYREKGQQIGRTYLPNSILVGTAKEGTIDLLQNRYAPNRTLIYVCIEGACKLPVTSVDKVLDQIGMDTVP
ncbi:MAG: thioredoxin domain-containing protein [Bacteroidota bacterium]